MDRKTFTQRLSLLGLCPFMISRFNEPVLSAGNTGEEDLEQIKSQKQFVENWLADLLESMDKQLDRETQEKLVGECGKACFNRHQFKKDIAAEGKDSLEKLIAAYSRNFEIWKDNNRVHIRYGEVSDRCYCPAANYRTPKPNDIHCECTKNTHKAIFETAMGRPFHVEIEESLRRGGKTCHFVVDLT